MDDRDFLPGVSLSIGYADLGAYVVSQYSRKTQQAIFCCDLNEFSFSVSKVQSCVCHGFHENSKKISAEDGATKVERMRMHCYIISFFTTIEDRGRNVGVQHQCS